MADNDDENSSFSRTGRILAYCFWFGISYSLSFGGIYVAGIAGLIASPTIAIALIASALISTGIIVGFSIALICAKYFYSPSPPTVLTKDNPTKIEDSIARSELDREPGSPKVAKSPSSPRNSHNYTAVTDIYTLQTTTVKLPDNNTPKSVPKPVSPRKGTLKLDEGQLNILAQFQSETDPAEDNKSMPASQHKSTLEESPAYDACSEVEDIFEKGELFEPTPSNQLHGEDGRPTPKVEAQAQSETSAAMLGCSDVLAESPGPGCSEVLESSDDPFDLEAAVQESNALDAELQATRHMWQSPPPTILYSTALVKQFTKDQARRRLQPAPSGIETEQNQAPNDLYPTTPQRELWKIRAQLEEKYEKERYRQEANVTPGKEEQAVIRALQTRFDRQHRSMLSTIKPIKDETQRALVIEEFKRWEKTVFVAMKNTLTEISQSRKHAPTYEDHKDENYKLLQHPHLIAAELHARIRRKVPSPPDDTSLPSLSPMTQLRYLAEIFKRNLLHKKTSARYRKLESSAHTTRKKLFSTQPEEPIQSEAHASTCSEVLAEESTEQTKFNSRAASSNCSEVPLNISETDSSRCSDVLVSNETATDENLSSNCSELLNGEIDTPGEAAASQYSPLRRAR